MAILGLWDGHDSGAALLESGRLTAAVNEERLTRRKLEIAFPSKSIGECLRLAGLTPGDVRVVAASTADPAKTLGRWFPSLKEAYYAARRRTSPPGHFTAFKKGAKYWITEWPPLGLSRHFSALALKKALARAGLGHARLMLFDHHACHAHTAARTSGLPRSSVITIDGVGDGLSATISLFEGGALRRVAASSARDSLGVFFEHVTTLLNMRELEDEGKVMALADYAAPVPDADNPLLDLFTVTRGLIRSKVPGHRMASLLRAVQWHYPNEQFAFMAQRTVERVCVDLVRDAVALTGCRDIALAGGVTSNVKANRLIRLLPEVETVYVFPHMGDGGLPLGAALAASSSLGEATTFPIDECGLGASFTDAEIDSALRGAGLTPTAPHDLECAVAELVAAGAIVMWFQGRMEYGPRALGHRSVLARPDRIAIRDRLNLVLKQRVWYQPFCPSMLESDAKAVLADYAGRPNVHMTMAYMVVPASRDRLAGVTSVDGSCRPQIIADDAVGRFPAFLRALKAQTGLGIVLNTSFNIHGEALVCTPAQAIEVYRRSGADALAIGSFLVVHRDFNLRALRGEGSSSRPFK